MSADSPAEPIVRDLLARAVDRLHALCARLLYRSYPRLTRGPLNLCSEEILGGVVERLLKAMRGVRPQTVRQFFALATQHMRWELNDLARRLDKEAGAVELRESRVPAVAGAAAPDSGASAAAPPGPDLVRILAAIDALPADEREAFTLVRVQGMTQAEAAQVVGVSSKTVQRRLNRALLILGERLGGLGPPPPLSPAAQA